MPSRSDDPVDPMVNERLEAYLDGELDASEALELEHALEGSPDLASELELAREVREALRGLPELDVSPVTLRRVMRRAAAETPRPASWRWRRAAALAAGVALAVLGLSLWRAAERPSAPGSAGAVDPVEVARAAEEARWVLARVDRLTRKAGSRVRQDVLARYLVAPTRRGVESSLGLGLGLDLESRSGKVPPPAGSSLRGEQQDDA